MEAAIIDTGDLKITKTKQTGNMGDLKIMTAKR
jgi:hypothetical protein